MIKLKDLLSEGKFQMKGKYLYMPGGEISSVPTPADNDALKVTIGRESFNIYQGRKRTFKYIQQKDLINQDLVWIHVSSVGEFEQAKPIIDSIKKSNSFSFV